MARRQRRSQTSDVVANITSMVASHPKLSAAVAFQMGLLLGNAMKNRDTTLRALKRGVEAAPTALAAALPGFDFPEPAPASASRRGTRKTARKRRKP